LIKLQNKIGTQPVVQNLQLFHMEKKAAA